MTIVQDEEMGGDARIKGTRIAVYHVQQYLEAGFSPQDIAEEFGIDRVEVEEAIEWAREHSE